MKSFKEFIFECYNSGCFLCEGRYKQESAFIRLFRQARGSKDWSKAAKLMDQGKEKEALELMQKVASSLRRRISDARNNPSSPLNYGRSDAKEYVKGKDAASEESFYDNLDAVADAVAHAPLEKKFRSAVTSKVFLGRQLFGTGTDIGRLTQLAQDAGIKSQTSTADFKLSSPRDSTKGSVGGSLKGGPAQIATAEPGDFRAAVKYAAQTYAANAIPETEKNYQKKRQEIIDTLISSGNEIAAQGESQRIPKERKSENEAKVAKAQSVLTNMYGAYPGFDSILSKTFASGAHRFQEPGTTPLPDRDVTGTASLMVHTPEPGQKGREFAIEPISQMEPVQGRASQGRGASNPKEGPRIQRPGTVRFDVNAPKEGEGTLSQAQRRAAAAEEDRLRMIMANKAEAQHAQTAQELEQQKVQAEIELKSAIKAHGEDDEPRYSDGKVIPRQFRGTWGQNNPQLKQEFDRQRAEKTSALQAAQNAHASAVDAHQTHISTPPPTSADLNTIGQSAPQAQQPTQQQPAPQQQPVSQQPDQNSEQRRKKEQDEMRKRMNAVAAENGAPNNA